LLSQRRFQFNNVFREIPSDCRISEAATFAANNNKPVARFQTRTLGATRRCRKSALFWARVNERLMAEDMDRLPSRLHLEGYHARSSHKADG